jgi:hypothetical protein
LLAEKSRDKVKAYNERLRSTHQLELEKLEDEIRNINPGDTAAIVRIFSDH